MDTHRYLRRIAGDPIAAADLAALDQLQQAHLQAVPFENLDIRRGRALVLDEAALFEKIVARQRGGICYELNTLFAALLSALGFQVSLLAAEVARPEGGFGPAFDHMALLVSLGERRFLVDVGFGDSFLRPLDLDHRGEQRQGNAAYEVHPDGDGQVVTRRLQAEGSAPAASFRFEAQPRRIAEFQPMCLHHQHAPSSHFTQKDICSRATLTGRITISGDQLIETAGRSRSVSMLRSAEQRRAALGRHFGIVL